jgi:branched-chain amino acid transport system permease protein
MRKYLAFAGASALLLWPVVFSTPYDIRLMTLAGVFAIAVIGYQFIFGNVGELSLAQAGFFGLGAYVTGILSVKLGVGFLETFALSILLPMLLAAIISLPLLRLAMHYYALATLGIAQTLHLLSIDWVSLTDGAIGLTGVPLPIVFGVQVPRGIGLLAFVWLYVVVAAVFAMQTRRGMYGLGCQLIRSNPMAAQAVGIDPNAVRFRMLLLSATFAGAAGALHAHTTRLASPGSFEFKVTATILAMAVIGGRTSVWGGIAAAILLVHMPEWLKGFEQAHLLVTSTILLVILYVAPSGFAGLVDKIWPADREDMRPEGAPLMKLGSSHAHTIPPDTSDDGAILTVKGLFKTFGGIHALDDVNFSLKRGSITALIGPNGSGKSTFINCVTGVYRPDGGQIALNGTSLVGVRPDKIVKLGIARTFQNVRLVDEMTVIDNVAIARHAAEGVTLGKALVTGRDDGVLVNARGYASAVLSRFGIGNLAYERCGSLAHGTKRIVEIARAVSLEPNVLLLDEPAAGLNETEQAELARILQLLADSGTTLLVVEHNLTFLKSLATDMVCLDYGAVIASGAPEDIYSNPCVIEAYIGIGHREEQAA